MPIYDPLRTYTRKELMQELGVTDTGGAWFTGHVRHNGEHYIFCNIKASGRTGQNYDNYFDEGQLVWHTRKGATLNQPVISELISNSSIVHIFYRTENREPFSYNGLAHAGKCTESDGVEIRWVFNQEIKIPEEIESNLLVNEGAKCQITVNAYERNNSARARCISKWKAICAVCDFDFFKTYGEIGKGYIHVHHLIPLSSIGVTYLLNPEEDLRPVCPNCHAMLHRKSPPLSLDELRELMR